MHQLDRYILVQLIFAFSFFTLIFTGVIWLTQSVRLIDTVINSGESAAVFLEFSLLLLPRVLSIVLPLSGFAASLYMLNKLYTESELVVMMTSGQSPFALARPMLIFGLVVFGLTFLTNIVLVPKGTERLEERRVEIRSELANALIVEGQFLHPATGVTLYIRDTSSEGEMAGIFLHDERDEARATTYSAERAILLRSGTEARLVMARGIALTYNADDATLSQVRFEDFTYDISDFIDPGGTRSRKEEEYPLHQLLNPTDEMRALSRPSLGDFVSEGHDKIVTAVNGLLLPLIALAAIISGGYQRRGFARRILFAIAGGVLLVVGGIAAKSRVSSAPQEWPVAYVAITLAIAGILVLLVYASARRRTPGLRAPT